MTETLIIQKAIEEIESRNFGATEQFLQVHEIEYVDGLPRVVRIDQAGNDKKVTVYFAVVGEKFFLAVYLSTASNVEVIWVDTASWQSVSFQVTSEKLSVDELCALTDLKPSETWKKGEKARFGNRVNKFSYLRFEPNPEPEEFEVKLKKLLNFLELDSGGVKRLVEHADGIIQVSTSFHNGNTLIGGHHLDQETIIRMAELKLSIDFDNYADGNKFKEPD